MLCQGAEWSSSGCVCTGMCVYLYLYFKKIHLRELIPNKRPGKAKGTEQLHVIVAAPTASLTRIYRVYFS